VPESKVTNVCFLLNCVHRSRSPFQEYCSDFKVINKNFDLPIWSLTSWTLCASVYS